jgi:hypothetical protein
MDGDQKTARVAANHKELRASRVDRIDGEPVGVEPDSHAGLALALRTASGLAAIFAVVASRRIGRWGATSEEVNRPLPGDDEVPDPAVASTRAISIQAPPGAIWPWLVQMGWRQAAGTATT